MRRFSAIRGMWVTGSVRGGVLRLRVGGRSAAHGRVVMRSGGRLRGRLGGRSFRVRLPGYRSSGLARSAATGRGAAARASDPRGAAFDAAFRAPFVAKSSHSRLVPSPRR
jgi:hypothetical protein